MGNKSKDVLSNLTWKFAERITAQIVTLVVSIILARLLEPSHYGTIAMVSVFISIANVFVSDGFGNALIQKKNVDSLDYASVLYFNIVFAVVIYLLLFIVAPSVSKFYGDGYEILTPVLRVLGLRLIASAINSVQQAYVAKNMMFKKFFMATLLGTVLSGIVGVIMAEFGFGVWALVAQYMTNTTIDTILLGISLHKKPIFAFSFKRLKGMFKFGMRILATGLLITSYTQLRTLIIGRLYSSNELAYYNKADSFPNIIVTNINTSIGAVLFPKMANEQDDIKAIKNTARISIRFSAYVMCPLMLGLLAVSKTFVQLVLTDKWLPCVPFMQWFCIFYLFQPIHTANMQAIKAVGRSDISLKIEIIKKTIELISLLLVMRLSVDAIVVSMSVLTTIFTFINAYPNKKLINYSYIEQVKDILPALLMSTIMALLVYYIGLLRVPLIIKLIMQVLCGGTIYLFMSICTKNKELQYIFSIIKDKK